MSAPTPPPPPDIAIASRLSAPAAFAWCAVPSLLGLALAVVLQLGFMLPKFGTGSSDLNRMIELGRHLGSPYRTPTAVAVGDSVTVEGIDASVVAANAPAGWTIENLGINGCDRAEVNVILPRVLGAKPRAVIFVLRPLSIAEPPPLSGDGAYAYALGGFRDYWPKDWINPGSPGVTEDIYARLTAPDLKAKVHFRTAVNYLINDTARAKIRKGITFARADDWNAPFNMTASVGGKTLDNHLKSLEEEVRIAAHADGDGHGSPGPFRPDIASDEADMERLIASTRAAGSIPVLIAAPVHPRLRDAEAFGAVGRRLRELAPQWAAEYGGVYADASALLDETGFADGQHLNAKGRELLSTFVGKSLPPPAKSPSAP